MGGDYFAQKEKLVKLRHYLVHNAINVESFLSRTEISANQHLIRMGTPKYIFVNTVVMYCDFLEAFSRFRDDMQNNPVLMKQAADRLEWIEDNPLDHLNPNVVMPTPPPAVEFIHARG